MALIWIFKLAHTNCMYHFYVKSKGMDSFYHVRTNVSVRNGIIWGMSIHSIHKEEVLFYSSVYI